jgi:uncharacterized repeat protein (TIGR01451 family)
VRTRSRFPSVVVSRTLGVSALVAALLAFGCGSSSGGGGTPPGPPLLSITKTHQGGFTQGQQNATYTVTVSNAVGAMPTSGTVTVTETVPSALTLVSMAGTGWTCTALPTCTRGDALAGGTSYPAITVTVNVLANASTPQVNSVSVSGGGSVAANTTDSTTIFTPTALQITKSHASNFTQGQLSAVYTVTVSNAVGAAPTSGTVTATETVPSGLTLVSMTGAGWTCAGLATCTRSDALAGGSSYPTITVAVNVLRTATSPQVNSVSVAGGGSPTANTTDSTAVFPQNWSSSSGSLAIITGTVGGATVDKVYIPLTTQESVAVLNADSASQTALVTSIAMPAAYQPSAVAASQATVQVVVISHTSADVQVIDASQDKVIATKTAPITKSVTFSSDSCMICGVLVDPSTNKAILDTAQGYMSFDLNAMTFSAIIPGTVPAENFALNPNTRVVLSPTYGQGSFIGLQAINLTNNSVSNFGGSVGVEPDSAAIDFNTGISIVPDESTTNQYLINMQGAVFSAGSFAAPNSIFPIGFPTCNEQWAKMAAESANHLLALAGEGDDCVAVETMPAVPIAVAPPTPATFHWGHMPLQPDGTAWSNGGFLHLITVFASVVDGKPYAILVGDTEVWAVRIDLAGLRDAAVKAGGALDEVDLTPFVFFLKTQ